MKIRKSWFVIVFSATASSQSAQLASLAFFYRRRAVTLKPLSLRQVRLACAVMWSVHAVLGVSSNLYYLSRNGLRSSCTESSTPTSENSSLRTLSRKLGGFCAVLRSEVAEMRDL